MLFIVDWGNKDRKRREGLEYFKSFFIPEILARRIVPQFAPALGLPLGLCRIAEGRVHALICNDMCIEDHYAVALILKESGGFVTNYYNTKLFDHLKIRNHCNK
jgi:hypothetical protein